MVKDHSDSEKENLLPPHRLLFLISSKGSFICIIPDRIAHTMAFVTLAGMKIAQWTTPCRIDPMTHLTMNERSTTELRPAP